jgi:hypothetical protein
MNPSDGLWGTLVYGVSTGGSLSVGLVFLRLLFGRLDRREAHIDTATKELIDELRKELDRLKTECAEMRRVSMSHEQLWRECEGKHAETHAELLKVQRLLQAGGEIRNSIQTGVAAEKLMGEGKGK